MWRVRTFLSVTLLVFLCAGCSHPLPLSPALQAPLKPDWARLVILYPAPIMGSNGMVQVKYNARQSCDMEAGSYIVRDVIAGDTTLAFSFCGLPGISKLDLKTIAGQTYYMRILPYDSSVRGMISGYPSEFPSPAIPVSKNPFKIEQLDAATAREAIKTMSYGKAQ